MGFGGLIFFEELLILIPICSTLATSLLLLSSQKELHCRENNELTKSVSVFNVIRYSRITLWIGLFSFFCFVIAMIFFHILNYHYSWLIFLAPFLLFHIISPFICAVVTTISIYYLHETMRLFFKFNSDSFYGSFFYAGIIYIGMAI